MAAAPNKHAYPRQLWLAGLLAAALLQGSGLANAEDEPSLASIAPLKGPEQPRRPKDFHAVYKAKFSGFTIEASRSLNTLNSGEQELVFSASTWLAKLRESSRFNWGINGHLQPKRYEYHREGLGRSRDAVLDFDWGNMRVTNNVQAKPWSMAIPPLALDKLSYQLQLRSDLLNGKQNLEYDIADGGRLKTYSFEMVGEEILDTRLGKLATIKVKKVRKKGKKRTTYIWMAKNWDYLLVKLQQTEQDGKTYAIHLLRAEVDGKTVTPRLGHGHELLPLRLPLAGRNSSFGA
ncbi:MAG: DUF3108 domain-containing protein [Cellvibrionaceae bacterium]|nr:DUF3108 domain-containing protein [Cellvibrionaceae bacterium]